MSYTTGKCPGVHQGELSAGGNVRVGNVLQSSSDVQCTTEIILRQQLLQLWRSRSLLGKICLNYCGEDGEKQVRAAAKPVRSERTGGVMTSWHRRPVRREA